MRVFWGTVGMLVVTHGICCGQTPPPQQAEPAMPVSQLVREVVYNELHDHQAHGFWRYWIERHTAKEMRLENQIETAQGPVTRLALRNGHPISTESLQQEDARFKRLLNSPAEQARHLQEYEEDEKRIGRILEPMSTNMPAKRTAATS